MDALVLVSRFLSGAVRQQILRGERFGVASMGIQSQQQRRLFLDDSYSGMPVPMNPSFVSLGQTEPPLQLQIVLRGLSTVLPLDCHEQPDLPSLHHLGQPTIELPTSPLVGAHQSLVSLPTLSQCPPWRFQQQSHRLYRFDLRSHLLLLLFHRRQRLVDEPGQLTQLSVGRPRLVQRQHSSCGVTAWALPRWVSNTWRSIPRKLRTFLRIGTLA